MTLNHQMFAAAESNAEAVGALMKLRGEDCDREVVEYVDWLNDCPTGPNRWYIAACEAVGVVAVCGMLPIIVETYDCRHVGALCNNAETALNHEADLAGLQKFAFDDMRPGIGVCAAEEVCCDVGWERRGVLELLIGETTRTWKEIRQFDYCDFKYYPTFRRKPVCGHPRFMVIRGEAFMKWRYSRPGNEYFQSTFPNHRHAIWKKHGSRKLVMETNSWETVTNLGGEVGVWQFRDTKVSKYLKGVGFKAVAEREFALRTDLNVDYDLDTFRFEICDNVDVA